MPTCDPCQGPKGIHCSRISCKFRWIAISIRVGKRKMEKFLSSPGELELSTRRLYFEGQDVSLFLAFHRSYKVCHMVVYFSIWATAAAVDLTICLLQHILPHSLDLPARSSLQSSSSSSSSSPISYSSLMLYPLVGCITSRSVIAYPFLMSVMTPSHFSHTATTCLRSTT